MVRSAHSKIFITGACGFVGNYVVREFLASTIHALHLNCLGSEPAAAGQRVFHHQVALTDWDGLDALFSKHRFEAVIHLSALARVADGEQHPLEAYNANCMATKILMEVAERHAVKNFLFVSSDLVRNPRSVVGMTKLLCESEIRTTSKRNMTRVILRLPNISWTPGSVHLIFERQLRERQPITITHPEMSRRFITGEEAAGYVLRVLHEGEDGDIFVVNKATEKITDLALAMMKEKGTNVEINYIGMRPGEKLVEEAYSVQETMALNYHDLALLTHNLPGHAEMKLAKAFMHEKLGKRIVY